jgi:lysozyme
VTHTQNAVAIVKEFESCRLTAYLDDGGVPTIGWGHTEGVYIGMTCPQPQADVWLDLDMLTADKAINSHALRLTQNEFDGLVPFVYNVGAGNFASSTLLKLMQAGNMRAAAEQFLVWDKIKGVASAGLLRRRKVERELFLRTT